MLFGQRPTRGSDGHSYGARVTATTSHVPSVTRIVLGSAAALLLASSIPAASATAGGGTVGPSVQGIRINFQLEGSERVCGYAPDYGDEYRERHGLRYGWNFDHTDVTRDRDRSNDQLLDTLSHFHRGGVWEIEVPNGVHDVKVVIGDAQHESRHTLNVEGVSYWDELYLDESEWRAEKRTVAVTDGRLTLDPGDAPDKATRIDYIEIDAQGAPPGCGDDEPTPVPSESPTPEPTPTVEPAPIPTQTPEIAPVRVNFQTEGTRVPCQYAADYGQTFRERDGLSYGWNVDHTDVTRDRGVKREQRLDTLSHFHKGGVWELAVANGPHQVTVSVGDPSYGASHTINVEGVNFVNRLELDANEFKLVTADVAVTDGRLTIDQGAAAEMATHINFVEVDAFVERDCVKDGGSKEDAEPEPEPTPQPKPKPKVPHLPSRPNGLGGLKRIFGKHCNGRTNDARTWYPSAGGRGRGGYVYYHSRLAHVVGRRVVDKINDRPGSADYGVWGYACRAKTGGTSWSVHSWGAAIDTNTLRNPFGQRHWNGRGSTGRYYGKYIPKAWMRRNFYWGLNFADPMHFQYVSGY